MPDQDSKRAAHQALVDRVRTGEGTTSPQQRACAFDNAGVPAPVDVLVDKVATSPTQVTDADFAAARAAGYTDDQVFELVVAAAVGQSARMYAAGLAALAEAARKAD
ncbi:hypothetical protein [Virgisporangium aurantiacum]|uniref:Uncharacterized protein n=1 Tax=Virgisporangium aurantiacum TaxID=175570 RepID=A0A8J3ZLC6_9ACTN|nr:hypothetical protein [Virgisporangium aurantiacum]GIJ63593.1 hypothetical protein Vau01_111090 [Virgisporangium aurantiacum]